MITQQCVNCNRFTGFKRALGFGTFFMVLITFGFWLLVIPFYPVRCSICGSKETVELKQYDALGMAIVIVVMFGGLTLVLAHCN